MAGSGGGRGDRAGRSSSERAAPSACVGRRLSAPQIVWNRSTRRAGARGGAAGRQAQMTENFDNHRRIIDGGDNLQGAAAVGTVFHVDVEDAFEQPGPLMRLSESSRIRLAKTRKTAGLQWSKTLDVSPGIGSPGKAGINGIQEVVGSIRIGSTTLRSGTPELRMAGHFYSTRICRLATTFRSGGCPP